MTSYTITVDDRDREHAPDKPWTASLSATPDGELFGCGIGATIADALRDLADEIPTLEHMCSECEEEPATEYGMCASCIHNARRSGWNPPV